MKIYRLIICILILSACKEEVNSLQFSELNINNEGIAIIEINIPMAEGNTEVSDKINETLNDFVCEALHIDDYDKKQATIEASINAFNESYSNFNALISTELKNELPVWEAFIDSEVIFKNETISCVAMNSSVNTGAAKSAMVFKFFNFNNQSGKLLTTKDIVIDIENFKTIVKEYYNKEVGSSFNDSNEIVNDKFELPDNLGFSEEGVIILYDNFDLGPFDNEIIEFTIPYDVANDYLNI